MLSSKNQWREKTIFFFLKTRLKKPFSLKGYPNAALKPTRINMTYIDPKKRLQFTEFLYSPYNNKKNTSDFLICLQAELGTA
jgi:hypothetical protein